MRKLAKVFVLAGECRNEIEVQCLNWSVFNVVGWRNDLLLLMKRICTIVFFDRELTFLICNAIIIPSRDSFAGFDICFDGIKGTQMGADFSLGRRLFIKGELALWISIAIVIPSCDSFTIVNIR